MFMLPPLSREGSPDFGAETILGGRSCFYRTAPAGEFLPRPRRTDKKMSGTKSIKEPKVLGLFEE